MQLRAQTNWDFKTMAIDYDTKKDVLARNLIQRKRQHLRSMDEYWRSLAATEKMHKVRAAPPDSSCRQLLCRAVALAP